MTEILELYVDKMLERLHFEKRNHNRTPTTLKFSIFLTNRNNIHAKLENVMWHEINNKGKMIDSFGYDNTSIIPQYWDKNAQVDKVQIVAKFADNPTQVYAVSAFSFMF